MAKNICELIDRRNPTFKSYVITSSLLILKMLILPVYIGILRVVSQIYEFEEDVAFNMGSAKPDKLVNYILLLQRATTGYVSDISDILPFVLIGFFYALTNPSIRWSKFLYWTVFLARLFYTFIVVIYALPQPTRLLAFLIQHLITVYMAVKSIWFFI